MFSNYNDRSSPRSNRFSTRVHRKSRAKLSRAATVERLEGRQLLTTVTGGGNGRTRTFEFLDASNNAIRVAMRGNIVVELMGLDIAHNNRIVNMQTTLIGTDPNTGLTPVGFDLFSIYVSQADINSSISIAMVPKPVAGGGAPIPRPMKPFTGSAGSFTINNATTGMSETISPGGSTGNAFLGGRTSPTSPIPSIPIISTRLNGAFGVRPADPSHKIVAGLQTAPGVSIGQFLFGGTIVGKVDIEGSCNLFYAGQIWTGDATGLSRQEAPTFKQNFYVGGDLRSLVTMGALGTNGLTNDPLEQMDYKTGFDMRVIGRLGEVYTRDSFLGAITVFNDPNFLGPGTDIPEVETRTAPLPLTSDRTNFEGDSFGPDEKHRAPSLGDTAAFNNDTPLTAQMLGTAHNSNNAGNIVTEVTGQLDGSPLVNDNVDYYSMALLSGQNIQVQVTSQSLGASFQIGVFDPDGRLVATDYSNLDASSTQNLPFRVNVDRPGVYKFAIAWTNDLNFNGVEDGAETAPPAKDGLSDYTMLISRAADLGFGGLIANGNIANTDLFDSRSFSPIYSPTIDVEEGDLGAIMTLGAAGGTNAIFIDGTGSGLIARPITVKHGNLRAIQSDSIGVRRLGEAVGGPDLLVPRGAVGLVRTLGTDDTSQILNINSSFVTPFAGSFNVANAVGFDYQLVDSATIFNGNLLADRGVGIVRADSFSTAAVAPRIAVNADNRGNDGFIDLIDCRTSFGTLTAGGPEITTGNSGNVRYIHVGDPALVFRDRFFGGGTDEETTLPPGEAFRYTDDSGATVKLSTLPAQQLGSDPIQAGFLTVETYGIRDKGGSVLINVDVEPGFVTDPTTGDTTTEGRGLQVDTGSSLGTGGAEIGSLNVFSPGTTFTFDPSTRTFTTGGGLQPADIILKGRLPVSVYDLSAHDSDGGGLTGFTSIDNRTSGELVNIEAASIGLLQGQNIGVAYSKTKESLQGVDIRGSVFPFEQQRTLIQVTGDIQTIRARAAVGNIQVGPTGTAASTVGNIGELSANTDGVNDPAIIDGIDAPVVAHQTIVTVNIGEQVTPSGSGDFELSGIFAGGAIGTIKNSGTGSDIRGDIVSLAHPSPFGPALPPIQSTDSLGAVISSAPAVTGIGDITLTNGAIIDTDIMVTTLFSDALELPRPFVLPGPDDPFFPTIINNISHITINGIGGIIGSMIAADTLGTFTIRGGFGFIDSSVEQPANSTFDGIDTDGYGVRLSTIEGGATVGSIIARGTGKLLNTLTYTPSVRLSETQQFDPYSGRLLTQANDLHKYLGTTRATPRTADKSVSGTVEDTTITGSRDLNLLSAFRILGRPTETNVFTDTPLMRISFAENIGKIVAMQDTDGLDLLAGTIGLLSTGRNFLNDTVSVNNDLTSMVAGGNIKASTTVDVTGGEGRIDNLTTGLALFGRIAVSQRIGKLSVGTDLGSPSVSSSRDITFAHINGSILTGALLRAANNINQLIIGHNIDAGGTVRAKRILTQTILGQVNGDIITG